MDKQYSLEFNRKVLSNIESIKNYSLIWKAINISSNLVNPTYWKISLSTAWSWTINTFYTTWATSTWTYTNYNELTPTILTNYSISYLWCWTLGEVYTSTWSVDITFQWSQMTLSWCSINQPLLKLKTKFKWDEKEIFINSISWLVEQK